MHPGGPPPGPATKDRADVERLQEHPVSMRRVFGLFRPHVPTLLLITGLIVATSGLTVVQPFLVRHAVDEAIPAQDLTLLGWLVGGMVGLVVLTQGIGVVQTWLSTLVGQKIMHRLRTEVFANVQSQALAFFTSNRDGEIQSRLTNDISGMRGVVTTTATSIATNVTMTVATIIAMVALSPTLSLLSLVVLPPAIWLTRQTALLRRRILAKQQRAQAQLQQTIAEHLSVSGMRLSKTMGAQDRVYAQFAKVSEELITLELESQLAGRWRMASMQIIFGIIPALVYLVAGLVMARELDTSMTIGTLIAFSTLQTQLFRPVTGLLNVSAQWVASMALFSRIFEYLDLTPDLPEPTQPADASLNSPSLTFRQVGYTYPGADRSALRGIDLHVPAGTTTALVGHTGSGKSTAAMLAARLADPTEGTVLLGGVDLRRLSAAARAQHIGVVSQETYLLHASVRENLLFSRPDATDSELWAALRLAHVDQVIAGLPEGLDTVVGSRGYRFSGGEQQRLSLARTLLRDPDVLILDEATSALDNETERAIQEAVLGSGTTRLVIAHRLSTIQDADQIVVLDDGAIVQRGTHAQLLASGGAYADLVAAAQARDGGGNGASAD
ncbi:ABC transporter ATP-binding protein [Corynebacterium lizhenjunii]|uniref:ABC transporter ATP-binding protein n=1 Tax=Corynebacterium lizhenjunii TaxID=2709394 RepID=A0A7T0KF90_9CORY|nr:ABC transporter ATP-binding protein [Corynebacterium lizhenjunii]QPK78984.1 ABC transporter ATP-binding protein [Corynebacterium lizhenjunii]